MAAVQLSKTVWLVGTSEQDSPAYTSSFDCSQFLIWDGSNGVLIDSGTGLGATKWLDNAMGVAPLENIAGVFITHYHADHAGGTSAAQARGLKAYASPLTAKTLASGDEINTQLARAREIGIYPCDLHAYRATEVEKLANLQTFQFGQILITVLDSPGHCDGHLVFEVSLASTTALFSGDTVFAEGKISMQAIADCRLDSYAETVIALARRPIEQLFAGHGNVVLENAGEHLRRAAEPFTRLVPPPNFLS